MLLHSGTLGVLEGPTMAVSSATTSAAAVGTAGGVGAILAARSESRECTVRFLRQ